MKWIFYILFLVNLALAAWWLSVPQVQSISQQQGVKDVGNLKIVSDVELKVRADFQADMEKELAEEKQKPVVVSADIEDELPRVEYDDFVFDDEDAPKLVCRQLGPFPTKDDAVNIAAGLAAYRLASKVTSKVETSISGYWSILPAPATVKEANELVKQLQSKGLVDVRRFVTGELENAISLGLFSSEINAVKRSRSVEKLGFVAIVKPKVEEREFYWLEYSQAPDLKLPLKGVKTNFPDVQIKPCSGIASN